MNDAAKLRRLRTQAGVGMSGKRAARDSLLDNSSTQPLRDAPASRPRRATAATPADDLKLLAAKRELLEYRVRRAVAAADRSGLSQVEIARSAGMSQPAVSRLLKRLRQFPELVGPTPRIVLLSRAVGEIPTSEAMDILSEFPWTFGHWDGSAPDGVEAWIPGSWDDLIGVAADLLREGEYDELRDRVRKRLNPTSQALQAASAEAFAEFTHAWRRH